MRSKRKKGEQMDPKKYFAKYDSRLRFEAVLKSLLPGLTIGLTAAFVMATVCWFCDFGRNSNRLPRATQEELTVTVLKKD